MLGRPLLKDALRTAPTTCSRGAGGGPADPDHRDRRSRPCVRRSAAEPCLAGIKASDNLASWADWTGNVSRGDKCGLRGKRQSGYCVGPFGQDAGSTYQTGCVIAKR